MAEIKHDITIKAPLQTVHAALATAQGLAAWFTPQVEGSGKVGTEWDMRFTDEPDFTWRITTVKPDLIAWVCIEGPGNAPQTEVEFLLKSVSKQETTLTIVHKGWHRHDSKFQTCVEIWRNLMEHLQRYCETGVAEATYH